MKPPTILVIEDNPISRKLVRVTLEAEGYSVVEAPDARTALGLFEVAAPDLVLQDLLLPDMDGFELVRRLRALPRGDETPIVALSGFLSRMEEAQVPATGFSDFLSKPVNPAQLVSSVRAHLPSRLSVPGDLREAPLVLAADDDPIQLKLMRLRLGLAGFRVSCAADGQEALEMATRQPPDAVLSDVVMPRLDGFRLCLALRSDPRLARVPVVLVSASFAEETDQRLAQDVGASALIARTADFQEAIQALRASLSSEPPRPRGSPERLEAKHIDEMIRRLEREVAVNRRLASRCSAQASALSVLSGIAETLAKTQEPRAIVREVLARCVDAGGLSLGVLYLVDSDGRFMLEAQQGYADALTARLEAGFGHTDLFREVLAKGVPVVIPSVEVSREVADDLLKEAGAAAAVVVPVVSHEEGLGVLLLSSRARVLEEGDWIAFARTVAAQVGQAVALTKAIASIAASEARYRGLLQNAGDAILILDPSGRIQEVNHQAEELLGRPRADIVGRHGLAFVAPDERQDAQVSLARLAQEGALHTETRHLLRADGSAVAVDLSSSLVDVGGQRLVFSIARDITQRIRVEEALRKLSGAVEQTPEAIFITDRDGVIEYVNPAFEAQTGYSREEALGQKPSLLKSGEHPQAFYESLWKAILSGDTFRAVFANRTKGGAIVYAQKTIAPLRDRAGRITHFLSTGQDITEQRQLEAQLRQAQKIEAIGQLAGGVAHDFNNILGVILGYGELAQRQLEPDHPVRARVDQMLKAAERAVGLTRQLLAFSRKQVMQPRLLDLNAVVADTHKMLGRLIGEDITLVVEPAPDLGTVQADPGQIEQIILNLAVNARDAMPKGGSLTLETANVDLDEDYSANHPSAPPGRYVMLAVSDTGMGMDQETQQRIFEPFFTTKPEGQGTGMGLATVYGIVKQSGGYIWVYSEPGRGTTFKVYLPRVEAPAEAARPAGPPGETPRGQETILLVEDTATLRAVIQETLEERGYTLLLASNGEQALALARERKAPIDLLLTDVVMPKLGGGDLAKQLLALRPEIRVLYMSGYTDGAISQHGVLGEGVMLLQKPFTADTLARAVRKALDGLTAS